MHDTTIVTPTDVAPSTRVAAGCPNPLVAALRDTIDAAHAQDEQLYVLGQELAEIRAAYLVAVALLADKDKTVDRARAENIHLRAQLRAVISGRTIAEERQQAEADAVAEWSQLEAP